ncbi:MAG: asparagine synthase (glutamine-hydrolyzing) [bacterium]|nr:asparagine synthase (glutamine-hydrolyzing) [bacterium]
MCGIVGIFNQTQEVSRGKLVSATRALIHRGPDGEGIWISKKKNVGLGHRRLSIIDKKRGAQPLVSNDGGVVAVVNGELYGYKKIRSDLQKKGYRFRTKTDSEIVPYLYQEYGLKFVDYLRGEFALIIYDIKKHKIVAARDRFGIKPLQYHLDKKGTLTIASEAKAIFASGVVKPCWDHYTLYHSFCLQYVPQDRTVFEGVYQLKPGHLLVYDGKSLHTKKYWDVSFPLEHEKFSGGDEKSLTKQLGSLLKESVRLRLQTDEANYCCHLSGGIDSALIAALAMQYSQKPLHCFTVSFPHHEYDEIKAAKHVARFIGATLTPVVVDSSAMVESFSDAVFYSEGLAINNHLVAKYILNKKIRKAGYSIALTGEGSDEAFAGYVHLRADASGGILENSEQEVVTAGVHFPVGQSLPLDSIKKRLGYLPTFLSAKGAIGFAMNSVLDGSFKRRYSSDAIVADFIHSVDVKGQLSGRNPVDQSSYLWIKFALANYILKTLGDGTEMPHSIEGRVPFLDHILFEFAKKIPLTLKIKNGTQKYILRKVAENYLPKEIVERPKQPFMAPPFSMLRDRAGMDFFQDTFRSRAFSDMGLFNQKKVLALLDGISDKDMRKQTSMEPVLMLMLSAFFLHQRYKISL